MAVSTTDFAALIGIDWADRKHDICLKAADQDALEFAQLEHDPGAIDAWAGQLRRRFAGRPVAVVLEQRKGPLIYALLKYDFLVLFPVNPQTLARLRRAFKTSRAKDDPTDAALMVEFIQRHGDKLSRWQPEQPAVRKLRLLTEMRRKAVDDQGRIINRLTASLKCYYPQVLRCFPALDTRVVCDFVRRWPDLATLKRARGDTLRRFFHAHNVRRASTIQARLDIIQAAQPLTDDPVLIQAYKLDVLNRIEQLAQVLGVIQRYDQLIAECFDSLPDARIFKSLPGAGPQLAPRLLAALGTRREQWPDCQHIQQYSGVAPVTERSGKKTWVHWRYGCPKFVRQSFVEWAGQSILQSFWAKAYYEQQMAKGKPRQVVIRSLAFKWIRILHRCWIDRVPYDESRYLMALQAKGSPLIAGLATVKMT